MARHGENIRKREDGRWEARLVLRPLPDGKKVVKSFYGSNYSEAKQRRTDFVNGLNKKTPETSASAISACPTVREIASAWMAAKVTAVKPSSVAVYSGILTLYILPMLGDQTVDLLDGDRIDAFLTDLLHHGRSIPSETSVSKTDAKGAGLSAKTVSNVKLVLMSILKYARKLKIISSVPECMVVTCVPSKIEILTNVEQSVLEDILFRMEKPIGLIALLSLYTGIRVGEACGLQWKDVDLLNGTLTVTKTVLRIRDIDAGSTGKTKVVVQSPKSDSSIRIIPIPEVLMDYLRERKAEDTIYLASGKEIYTEPRVCQYRFKMLLKKAGIRDYNFHVLRHTFATRCIENDVDVKSLSEILGHSNVTITMQRYVHPSLEMKRVQINKLTKISELGQN